MSEAASQDLVERFLAALNGNDMDAALALLSIDVAFDTREGTREIGRDKVHWHLGLFHRHFREQYEDIAVMVAPGGVRAAAEFTISGKYLSSKDGFPEATGQNYQIPAGMFFEIDDDQITRVTTYVDTTTWRAALS
jgi:steroid delta-isomerase-like uncharacterized protein